MIKKNNIYLIHATAQIRGGEWSLKNENSTQVSESRTPY